MVSRREEEIEDSEATLRVLINAPTEGRLLIDAGGTIVALNDRACERLSQLSGQRLSRPEKLIGLCVYDLFPRDLAAERRARNERVLRSQRIVRFEDERGGRWMENTICPVHGPDGKVTRLVILSRDITLLKEAQQELRAQASELERVNHYLTDALGKLERSRAELKRKLRAENERARRDPLTRSLNRGALMDILVRLTDKDSPFAVALLDVDRMKRINDTYGHQTGDAVLRLVARSLSRDGAVVGRLGGDEFVAILPNAQLEIAQDYCQYVQNAVASARLFHKETRSRVPISVSIGVAYFPQDSNRAPELIHRADSAMYAARRLHQLRSA